MTYDYDDNEAVVVTLETTAGTNTLAILELTTNGTYMPVIRRVPYTGGARWVVTAPPRYSGGNWQPTTYNFTVQTLVDGTLSAGMRWEV